MVQGLIYMVGASGGLTRMRPAAPENEDRMQALVAQYPEIISDGDGDLLLIQREQAISDSGEGPGRWSLDHLFVTRSAVPVLVELKRAVDTRLRREVVGQMLDYAANATAYWQAGRVAESFAKTAAERGEAPETALAAFIGDQDPEAFWQQVDANFMAGRIKLVFVADEIPRELARIVEFLNDQMRADVRAVELRWFAGEDGAITLSPRLIGETERSAIAKKSSPALEPISREQWLQKYYGSVSDLALAGARSFVAMVERLGGKAEVTDRQGSIYAGFRGSDGKEFYPMNLQVDSTVSFSLAYLYRRQALQNEPVRRQLLEGLDTAVGPLSTQNLKGFPAFKAEILADPAQASALAGWLKEALKVMA